MEASHRVHRANPAAIEQYSGLKYTDDHSDACWLAHLFPWEFYPKGKGLTPSDGVEAP